MLLRNLEEVHNILTNNQPAQHAPGVPIPALVQPQQFPGLPNSGYPKLSYRVIAPPLSHGRSSRVMYSGHGCSSSCNYYNTPDLYSNNSHINTEKTPAPYSGPAGLAGVSMAAAPGAPALLQTVPSSSTMVAVGGRGRGRVNTPSSIFKSVYVPNMPVGGVSNVGDSIQDTL